MNTRKMVFSAIVAVVILGAIYSVFFSQTKKKMDNSETTTETNTTQNTNTQRSTGTSGTTGTTGSTGATSGWMVYKNTALNLTLKYPPTMELSENKTVGSVTFSTMQNRTTLLNRITLIPSFKTAAEVDADRARNVDLLRLTVPDPKIAMSGFDGFKYGVSAEGYAYTIYKKLGANKYLLIRGEVSAANAPSLAAADKDLKTILASISMK